MKKEKIKIIAVIQARMGSKRLPQKALLMIGNRTLIGWIKYRLSFAKEIDGVVLGTADSTDNDILALEAKKMGIPCFRGSETDLISRLLNTARHFKANAIVRITGDCPFVDPLIVDKLVQEFRMRFPDIDYVSNVFPPTFPDGLDVEVISTKTLERLDSEIKNGLYREWLTMNILENPDKFAIFNVQAPKDLSEFRLTVDYPEDFKLAEILFRELHREGSIFNLDDIMKLFKKKPRLLEINENRIDVKKENIRSSAFRDLKNKNKTKKT